MKQYIMFYAQALVGTALWLYAGYHSVKALSEGLTRPNFVRFFTGVVGATAALTIIAWATGRTFGVQG